MIVMSILAHILEGLLTMKFSFPLNIVINNTGNRSLKYDYNEIYITV